MENEEKNTSKKKNAINPWFIVLGVVILLSIIGLVIFALLQDAATTAKIRDIFIIFLALESLVIGAALVILVIQLAGLINLLQNEVQPIVQSLNETINTLRGTTYFLSENLTEPVIKMNAYLAGLQRFVDLLHIKKGKK